MKKIITLFFCFCVITLTAQWKYANFPYGGHIFASTSKGNVTLAQSANGLYRTTNNGSSWQLIDSSISVSAFLVHNNDIFIAGNGVYRSSDDGLTWKKLPFFINRTYSIAISGDTIYVGGASVIHKSTDYGISWKTITINEPSYIFTDIAILGSTIFAATLQGFLRSTNNGVDWSYLNSPAKSPNDFLQKKDSLYALASNNVYVTIDTGKTWKQINIPVAGGNLQKLSHTGGAVFYATTSNGVYKSIDNGVNWFAANKNIEGISVESISSSGTNLFAGTEYGMYLSVDGAASWTPISSNMIGMQIWQMINNGKALFASTMMGIYASYDHGSTWKHVYTGLSVDIAAHGSTICAVTSGGKVLISDDNGANWKTSLVFTTSTGLEAVAFQDSAMIVGTWDYGIYQSINKGDNWTKMDSTTQALPAKLISYIHVTGNAIFVGTHKYGLYRSTDKGKSWKALTNGLASDLYIATIDHSGSTIAIGTEKDVYLSADNGDSWTSISSGAKFPLYTVNIIDNYLFAGNDQFYVTPLNSISWKELDFNSRGGCTSFVKDADNLYIATYGSGVWYKPLKEIVTGISENPAHQNDFSVFPNPNNGQFTLLQPCSGLIEIYNVLGERVFISEINDLSSQIDLGGKGKGIYFLKRSSKGSPPATQKIIFQ